VPCPRTDQQTCWLVSTLAFLNAERQAGKRRGGRNPNSHNDMQTTPPTQTSNIKLSIEILAQDRTGDGTRLPKLSKVVFSQFMM